MLWMSPGWRWRVLNRRKRRGIGMPLGISPLMAYNEFADLAPSGVFVVTEVVRAFEADSALAIVLVRRCAAGVCRIQRVKARLFRRDVDALLLQISIGVAAALRGGNECDVMSVPERAVSRLRVEGGVERGGGDRDLVSEGQIGHAFMCARSPSTAYVSFAKSGQRGTWPS